MRDKRERKGDNYRLQSNRLKKAISEDYYFEAMFIIFAIIEDKTKALLSYFSKYDVERNELFEKLEDILKLRENNSLIAAYISEDVLYNIADWQKRYKGYEKYLLNGDIISDFELSEFVTLGKTLSRAFHKGVNSIYQLKYNP